MTRDSARVAYVISEYPKISHTFVMREVAALRRRGLQVDTVSIRRAPEDQILSDDDRRVASETFAVLPVSPADLARAHVGTLARRPARYLSTLALSFRVGPPGLRNRAWQMFYFVEAIRLAEELRGRGVTHLHAHFVNVASSVAMLAANVLDRPWSFTMHGPLEFDNVEQYGIAAKVERAAFVACISDFCKAQIMRLVEPGAWPRLHVVHCGLEPGGYVPGSEQPDREVVEVVSVGRLAPMKGYSVLLDAVGQLVRAGDRVHLTLVGDGPDRAHLEREAERLPDGTVSLVGAQSAARVTELLGTADLFCLPSFAEGVPVVLMEAMASGLPVVATNVMGIPELVRDGAGLLVPPGRTDALAEALAEFIRSPVRRAEAGAVGRAIVTADFAVDDSAEQLSRLFETSRRD